MLCIGISKCIEKSAGCIKEICLMCIELCIRNVFKTAFQLYQSNTGNTMVYRYNTVVIHSMDCKVQCRYMLVSDVEYDVRYIDRPIQGNTWPSVSSGVFKGVLKHVLKYVMAKCIRRCIQICIETCIEIRAFEHAYPSCIPVCVLTTCIANVSALYYNKY